MKSLVRILAALLVVSVSSSAWCDTPAANNTPPTSQNTAPAKQNTNNTPTQKLSANNQENPQAGNDDINR